MANQLDIAVLEEQKKKIVAEWNTQACDLQNAVTFRLGRAQT